MSATGALVLAAAMVWETAYAGFNDTTGSFAAGVSTGTVVVDNDIQGLPALTLGDMLPGESETACILVTSTGSEPAGVRLYSSGKGTTKNVSAHLTLAWTAGTGGGVNGDCTGFVPGGSTVSTSMSAFPTTYAGGILAWDTAGNVAGESRTYRLTYGLAAGAPASTKGGSATVTFVWEARQR